MFYKLENSSIICKLDLWQIILDKSYASLSFKNSSLRYIALNKRSIELIGNDCDKLIGRTDKECIPEPAATIYSNRDLELIEMKGTANYKVPYIDVDRNNRLLYSKRIYCFDENNKFAGIYGISKEMENMNLANDIIHRLQESLYDSDFAIFTLDLEGNIVSWNRKCEEFTHFSLETVLDQPLHHFLSGNDLEKTIDSLKLLRCGETIKNFACRFLIRTGIFADVILHLYPIFDSYDKIIGSYCFFSYQPALNFDIARLYVENVINSCNFDCIVQKIALF